MAIKGARTISEYAIRKWMAREELAEDYITITMNGNEGTLVDRDGNYLVLVYDPGSKSVYVKE